MANNDNPLAPGAVKAGGLGARPAQVQQVAQVRSATVANSASSAAGIPAQVSNLTATVKNASTGATCSVTVTFRRDPTDKSFSRAIVYVTGYQGNPSAVQVASGVSSPITFVLNNTGESISITVQAQGNGGSAPIGLAPVIGARLPKSTGGGYGATTVTQVTTSGAVSPVLDGLTHSAGIAASPAPQTWESDPAYICLRDDFHGAGANGSSVANSDGITGSLNWNFWDDNGGVNKRILGGAPPHLGIVEITNSTTSAQKVLMALGTLNGQSTAVNLDVWPLFDYPGWKMTWVFRFNGYATAPAVAPAFTKKSIYIGAMGSVQPTTNLIGRPDQFLGLRYDTSLTPGTLTLSSVANASGGTTTYTGTITGGTNGAYVGQTFVIAGFTTGANNGTFTCLTSSATTLVLNNASGVAETHAATAAGGSPINDGSSGTFKFEQVQNPSWTTIVRHNLAGQVYDTGITPAVGTWYRLDMSSTTAGSVTLTLTVEGGSQVSNTFTIGAYTWDCGGTTPAVSSASNFACLSIAVAAVPAGTSTAKWPPFGSGSKVTLAGLTGGAAGLNGSQVIESFTNNPIFCLNVTGITNFASNFGSWTMAGYPALGPALLFGNDDQSSTPSSNLCIQVDFFAFVWNPNLSAAGGSPSNSLSRYF